MVFCAELLHTTQRHAQVLGFPHDTDALRSEMFPQPVGYLDGQALLYL